MIFSGKMVQDSLVPDSRAQSDISCHIGQGLQHKECHNCILHLGLKFPDDLECCTVWFTKA